MTLWNTLYYVIVVGACNNTTLSLPMLYHARIKENGQTINSFIQKDKL